MIQLCFTLFPPVTADHTNGLLFLHKMNCAVTAKNTVCVWFVFHKGKACGQKWGGQPVYSISAKVIMPALKNMVLLEATK